MLYIKAELWKSQALCTRLLRQNFCFPWILLVWGQNYGPAYAVSGLGQA